MPHDVVSRASRLRDSVPTRPPAEPVKPLLEIYRTMPV